MEQHFKAVGQDPVPTLEEMSVTLFEAMREMRLNPAVPNVFTDLSDITGGAWRSVVQVVEVALVKLALPPNALCSQAAATKKCDLLRQVVHSMATWYFASSKRAHDDASLGDLDALTTALYRDLNEADSVFTVRMGCPKVHRISHTPEVIADYGPFDCLTAEMGEAAHQQFKKMFRRCACAACIGVCVCVCVRAKCVWV